MLPEQIQPPRWATALFRALCRPEYLEDILGDLEEEFSYRVVQNQSRARWWFVLQMITLMRPGIVRPFLSFLHLNSRFDMFKNYLTIGYRNLVKYKASTAINLLGLSTGLAAFLIIALFVKDELSYDRHHEHADNVFRVTVQNFNPDGELNRHWAFASAGHAPRLKADFPQITHATRFYPWVFPDILVGERRFPSEQVVFADPDVFDIFTLPFLAGSSQVAFKEMTSIVISEEAAIRLYGNDWREQDIIGQALKLEEGGQGASLTVTGVFETMPRNQHFHFHYLAPFAIYENVVNDKNETENVGGNYNYITYVRLSDPSGKAEIEAGSDAFFDKHIGPIQGNAASSLYRFVLQPLKDIHLTSNLAGEIENNGSLTQVITFSIVGILLIIVACINYMNLATSRYTRRMKEIGVRKFIGASKFSLIGQFVTESALVTVLSFPLAVGLASLCLPSVNAFMDKQLSINLIADVQLFLAVLILLVTVALVAGLYPAIYLSRIETVKALKGEAVFRTTRVNFRSALVTFQYMVTIGIIFALAVVNAQMRFIFNSNPGFDKESIVIVSLSPEVYPRLESFKSELLSNPDILKAAYASRIPTGSLNDNQGANIYIGDSLASLNFRLPYITVDEDFVSTFSLDVISGQAFEAHMDADSIGYYLLNEAAAIRLGFSDPAEVVGMKLNYGGRDGTVVGIVRDFHFESVHVPIGPMILVKSENSLREICLKVAPTNLPSTLQYIESTWDRFDSKNPIAYSFLDESFQQQYESEERLSLMFSVFTVVAVLISCLGMLGMVSFTVERMTKEIGIRKVLGAQGIQIMWLISRGFVWLIGIACLVALPLSGYLMSDWLAEFAYRVRLSPMLFLIPIGLVLGITCFTILYRLMVAVKINPVKYLRSE